MGSPPCKSVDSVGHPSLVAIDWEKLRIYMNLKSADLWFSLQLLVRAWRTYENSSVCKRQSRVHMSMSPALKGECVACELNTQIHRHIVMCETCCRRMASWSLFYGDASVLGETLNKVADQLKTAES